MNPGFEGLKIISARKDGDREGVPVPKSHRDSTVDFTTFSNLACFFTECSS